MNKETRKEDALHLLAQKRRLITERIKALQVDLEAIERAEEILSEDSKEDNQSSMALEKVTAGYQNLTLNIKKR